MLVTYWNQTHRPSLPSSLPVCPFTFGADLKATMHRLLEDPAFLPKGGHLGFGLSHRYPVELEEQIGEETGRQQRP